MIKEVSKWKTASLSQLVIDPRDDVVDGPFGSRLKASEYVNSGIPIVRLQNIDRNRFIDKNLKFVTKEKASEISRHHFVAGDILISKLGDPLGEACVAPSSITYGILVADVVRVRPNRNKVDTAFLTYALNSTPVISQFEAETKGTTRPRVNLRKIRDLQIPILEDLDEQREIVAEIEKQFTRLEAGVAGLRRVQANLKRYRAAVLKAACEGKLVPTEAELARQEGRSYETGAQLLERILDERRQKWNGRGKYKDPMKFEAANLPLLPDGWEWATLEQVATRITYGITVRPKYVEEGVPLISAREIAGGKVNLSIANLIAERDFEMLRDKCRIHKNDVLFSKTGTIGKVALVSTDDRLAASQNIAVISPIIDPLLLKYVLMSPRVQDLASRSVKITAIPDLQLGHLSQFPIPLPPLEEQRRIIGEVERRVSVVEELASILNANVQRATHLRQSVLKRAFEGKLVQTTTTETSNIRQHLPMAAEAPFTYGGPK